MRIQSMQKAVVIKQPEQSTYWKPQVRLRLHCSKEGGSLRVRLLAIGSKYASNKGMPAV